MVDPSKCPACGLSFFDIKTNGGHAYHDSICPVQKRSAFLMNAIHSHNAAQINDPSQNVSKKQRYTTPVVIRQPDVVIPDPNSFTFGGYTHSITTACIDWKQPHTAVNSSPNSQQDSFDAFDDLDSDSQRFNENDEQITDTPNAFQEESDANSLVHINNGDGLSQINVRSLSDLAASDKGSANKSVFSSREISFLKLASILQPVNAPKHLYNKIVEWAKDTNKGDVLQPIRYDALVSLMARKTNTSCTFPSTDVILLPSENLVTITKFNFVSQVYSLLSDETLMQPHNLIFGSNPFKKFEHDPANHVYGDVETSDWMIRTQKLLCTEDHHVLAPITMYCDKTHVKGNASEPLSWTFGWFKQGARNSPETWRHHGYIPGLLNRMTVMHDRDRGLPLASSRNKDYHYVLKYLLQDFIDVQKAGGLDWVLNGKPCKLIFAVNMILGDIEGHDKLCSRKACHSATMNGVTHSCNITRDRCGDPLAECRMFFADEIFSKQRQYRETQDQVIKKSVKSDLDKLGFYADVTNAFEDVQFGDNEHGLHGACCICLLHTFKQRYPDDCLEMYMNLFGVSEGTVSKLGIDASLPRLMEKIKHQSDRNYPAISNFTFALTKGKHKYDANEKFARIFALFLFTMTTFGWTFTMEKRKLNEDTAKKRIELLESSLTTYKYMYQAEFHVRNRNVGKNVIRKFLTLYKEVVEFEDKVIEDHNNDDNEVDDVEENEVNDDDESEDADDVNEDDNDHDVDDENDNDEDDVEDEEDDEDEDDDNDDDVQYHSPKCKFPKFHYLLHIIWMIFEYGSSRNFDGGPCESNHKVITKNPGMKTNGRADTFDFQTSNVYASQTVIRRALALADIKQYSSTCLHQKKGDKKDSDEESNAEYDDDNFDDDDASMDAGPAAINTKSARFQINCNSQNRTASVEWKQGNVKPTMGFKCDVVQFAYERLFNVTGVKENEVEGFTCLSALGSIFRAHPSYRSKSSWFDYANIKWCANTGTEETYVCPAKIEMLIDLTKNTFHNNSDLSNELYAIIRSVQTTSGRHEPVNVAKQKWRDRGSSKLIKYWTIEDTYWLVPVSTFSSVSFMVPDYSDKNMSVRTNFIMEVLKYDSWEDVHNLSPPAHQ